MASRAKPRPKSQAPGKLILPAGEIFSPGEISGTIAELARSRDKGTEARAQAAKALAQARKDGLARIQEAFAKNRGKAKLAARSISHLTDEIVRQALAFADPDGASAPSLVAVGGYGRGEMAPHSDADLLFLTEERPSERTEEAIQTILYILWDIGMKVGHATRSPASCVKDAKRDFTIQTSLTERRMVAGSEGPASALDARILKEVFIKTAPQFIKAKLDERQRRHANQGGQRFMLEPDVKEGKGGLRDLQSLFWITKAAHQADRPEALVDKGVFTREEYARFQEAEEFLWAVRCHLHFGSRRAAERLTFDAQVQVAERMGYRDGKGRRAVERFMQDYFRQTIAVGNLSRIFLIKMESVYSKKRQGFRKMFRTVSQKIRRSLDSNYSIISGHLAFSGKRAVLKDRLNILRIFHEALKNDLLIHPEAMRLISANLDLIDAGLRKSDEARKIFMSLLLSPGNPERVLNRMNELGVLGKFIPEFGDIVAMMQFNMYHHYTVDEHTIQCISSLAQIERGELKENLPVASGILTRGVNRRVLYVALLLHDIGKGSEEDHSERGARMAERIAPRLGLSPDETETVVWLVRHHLLMSDVAQKRNLSDPKTIEDFTGAVETRERLDLLTVLTVCDIRGVGPGTLNSWKQELIRTLYHSSQRMLAHGGIAQSQKELEREKKDALKDLLDKWSPEDIEAEAGRHYTPYWLDLSTDTHASFARLLRNIKPDQVRFDVRQDPDRDATRVCFALKDDFGTFARLAGILALAGANVASARSYTSADGYDTAAFWIQDSRKQPLEKYRMPKLKADIEKFIGRDVAKAMARKKPPKPPRQEFPVPTEISFDNSGSEIFTIIEVDTHDHEGLLYDLAKAVSDANLYIASVLIATYAQLAVDVFYVKDRGGLKIHSGAVRRALARKLHDAAERRSEKPGE